MNRFRLGAKRPLVIAGPCSAETEEQTLATCEALAREGCVDVLRAGIWKPRTRPGTFEGVGARGLKWLAEAKRRTGLPVATEVASAKHVESALAAGVDLLWLGARTTVNPFLVQEIAEAAAGSDAVILVKNPLNPDAALWAGAVARLEKAGIARERIGLVHRGFSTGTHWRYRNDPMWHIALDMRSRCPGMVMLGDPSHICGTRKYLYEVAQTAADLNFDGLMMESHCRPAEAWSDAEQQLEPKGLAELLRAVNWRAVKSDDPEYVQVLGRCRTEIDRIDNEIFELLSHRMQIADRIGAIKRDNDVVILQSDRWAEIVERAVGRAAELHLGEKFLRTLLEAIHLESIDHQNRVMNGEGPKSGR